jgi:haloacid dehalogenase-like hydrolase
MSSVCIFQTPACTLENQSLSNNMIQLLSTDFDGTLVNHETQPAIAPTLFPTLLALRKREVKWAVNTGRTLMHLEDGLTREYRFPFMPDYAIVEERDVYRHTRNGGWEPLSDWNQRAERDHAEFFHLATPLLAEVLAFMEKLDGANAIYDRGRFIGAVTSGLEDMDRLCGFLDRMRERLPLFNYQRNTIYIRFCHNAYSKGTALGELSRHLGIERSQIFAAGDHHNDIAMLDGSFAKYVTCPSNSCEEVKLTVRTAGGYLANTAASEGVVEALRHFGILNELA